MKRITFIKKFSVLYFAALIVFITAFGWIVGIIEERSMLKKSKLVTAEIVIANVQKYFRPAELLTPKTGLEYERVAEKIRCLSLGSNVERIKIWNKDKVVVWADDKRIVGKQFSDNEELEKATKGEIVSEITITNKSEHEFEKQFERLHELYVPIRFDALGDIETVFEIYQNLDALYMDISNRKKVVWISTVLGFGFLYLMFFGIIWSASRRIEAQTRKISKSEEKYRTLVQSAQDGIISIDRTEKVILCNEAAARMFGYAEGELIDQPISMLMPEKYRAKHQSGMLRFLKTGKMIPMGKTVELEGLRKDGLVFPMELSLAVSGESDSPTVTAILRDISERKTAEEERKKLTTQMRQTQKMESIGTLAGGIAHDFNNILYPIIGYTEMSMEDLSEDSIIRSNMKEVLKAAKRAQDLVKQILAFSRKTELKKKPVQVRIIIKEVLKFLRASLPSTINITQKITSSSVVQADPTQIHQVIMNLCTNAYHAMEDTGGVLTVSLTDVEIDSHDVELTPYLEPGKYQQLSVSDTGHGMEPAILEKIFEPYFTTKEDGKGTGMGLSATHGIVKGHNGHISVNSEIGMGTTFRVYLPLITPDALEEEVISTETIPEGKERILLVDDEEQIVLLLQQILERLGYRVTARFSSTGALEVFRKQPDKFDLVITDLTMPNMTGDRFAGEVMNIRPDIPVILCTGFSEKMSGKKADALGIKGFLMKPIVKSDLARTVRRVLDESKGYYP